MLRVKDVVRNAKDEGLKIVIGGDMNAHIWELDKCENNNVKLLKNMVNEMNLQIMKCVWERMNGPTWFSENSEFTLDYICVDGCALKCVQSAYILEREIEEVVESDHALVGVDVEWKAKRKTKVRRKMRTTRKRRLAVDKWEEFVSLFTTHMQTSSQFRKPSSPLKPKHQKYITSHQCAPIGCTRQEVGSLHSLETTSYSLQQTYLRLLIHTT